MAASASDDGSAPLLQTADLLTRAQAGDAEARDALFQRYRPPLERFLHARLPLSARALLDTDDAVQEVCARAFASLPRFEYRGIGSFWSYLRTIAFRYAGEVFRRERRKDPSLSLPDDSSEAPQGSDRTPSAEAAVAEELELFEKALVGISERERDALLMRLELDLDYALIASQCGYPSPDAARMAIRRVMGRVAREMSRGGFET